MSTWYFETKSCTISKADLICLDCTTRWPRREQPTFYHFFGILALGESVKSGGGGGGGGGNAILGLSRAEMVRNTCFHIKYSLIHL